MFSGLKQDARIIWFFLSKYKKLFYLNYFLIISGSVLATLLPFSYGRITDLMLAGAQWSALLMWLGILSIIILLKDWLFRLVFAYSGKISVQCSNNFTLLLNRHALNLRLAYHHQNKSGKLSSRYINAADSLEMLLESFVFWFAVDYLSVGAALVLIAYFIHWQLAIFILTLVLIYAYCSYQNSIPVGEVSKELSKTYEEAYGLIQDSIGNIKVVKAYTNEQYDNDKVAHIYWGRAWDLFLSLLTKIRRLLFFQDILMLMIIVGSFLFLSWFAQQGKLSGGQIVSFVGYLALIRQPLHNVGRQMQHYRKFMARIRRGYELLDEEVENYSAEGKHELHDIRGEVEFKQVSFAYNQTREVLSEISLKVKPGEMVALVGESGVGKSTLMDLISRYIDPTAGKILLDGQDIRKARLDSLRDQIAIVPQDVSLFNDTLRNNLRYGNLEAEETDIVAAVRAANMEDFVSKLPNGLEEQVGERGVHLSGGQKQRVAIARAILKNPKILILDEATSALDSKSEQLVQEALKKLIQNRTTFVIAHRLSTITHANQIVVLEKGRIVEIGTHTELLERGGAYAKLYALQTKPREII